MGCDIHPYLEVKQSDGRWRVEAEGDELFYGRDYRVFGWLANMRNYSAVEPTTAVHEGWPKDASIDLHNTTIDHSPHWADLKDLLAIDYDQEILDRRVTRQIAPNIHNGGCTTDDPNEATKMPLRKFLGEYMDMLKKMETIAAGRPARLLFGFDS